MNRWRILCSRMRNYGWLDNGQEKVRGLKSEGGGGNEMGGDEPGVM